jgi:hypothetical protein
MAIAGAVCMGLCLVLALALFEVRVPAATRVAAAASDRTMPLLAVGSDGGQADGSGSRLAEIPLAEVGKHNSAHDCWLVIHGYVYDVTSFLASHPGMQSPFEHRRLATVESCGS